MTKADEIVMEAAAEILNLRAQLAEATARAVRLEERLTDSEEARAALWTESNKLREALATAREEGRRKGRAEERAAVVMWLRGGEHLLPATAGIFADDIESGEHISPSPKAAPPEHPIAAIARQARENPEDAAAFVDAVQRSLHPEIAAAPLGAEPKRGDEVTVTFTGRVNGEGVGGTVSVIATEPASGVLWVPAEWLRVPPPSAPHGGPAGPWPTPSVCECCEGNPAVLTRYDATDGGGPLHLCDACHDDRRAAYGLGPTAAPQGEAAGPTWRLDEHGTWIAHLGGYNLDVSASYSREGWPLSVDVNVQMEREPVDTFGGELGISGYTPEQVSAAVEEAKRFAVAVARAARPASPHQGSAEGLTVDTLTPCCDVPGLTYNGGPVHRDAIPGLCKLQSTKAGLPHALLCDDKPAIIVRKADGYAIVTAAEPHQGSGTAEPEPLADPSVLREPYPDVLQYKGAPCIVCERQPLLGELVGSTPAWGHCDECDEEVCPEHQRSVDGATWCSDCVHEKQARETPAEPTPTPPGGQSEDDCPACMGEGRREDGDTSHPCMPCGGSGKVGTPEKGGPST
jgi:hypothetical protein